MSSAVVKTQDTGLDCTAGMQLVVNMRVDMRHLDQRDAAYAAADNAAVVAAAVEAQVMAGH